LVVIFEQRTEAQTGSLFFTANPRAQITLQITIKRKLQTIIVFEYVNYVNHTNRYVMHQEHNKATFV
jgi:hypothetical protein